MPQGKKGTKRSATQGFLHKCQPPAPGQEDGNDRGEGREDATRCKEKEVKTVQSSTTCGGCRRWCLGRPAHIAPLYAWQEDVEASVVNAWQIPSFCHFLVAGPSCLTEPSVFRIVDPQGRTDFRGVPQGSASPSSNTQICKPRGAGNDAKVVNDLVALVPQEPSGRDHNRGTWTLLKDDEKRGSGT